MKIEINEQERCAIIAALGNYYEVLRDGAVDTVGEFDINLELAKILEAKLRDLKE